MVDIIAGDLPAELDDDVGLATPGAPDDTVIMARGKGDVRGGGCRGVATEEPAEIKVSQLNGLFS